MHPTKQKKYDKIRITKRTNCSGAPQTVKILQACVHSVDGLDLGALSSQKGETSTELKDLQVLTSTSDSQR